MNPLLTLVYFLIPGRGHAAIQGTIAQDHVLDRLLQAGQDRHVVVQGTPEMTKKDPRTRIVVPGKMAMRTVVITMLVMTRVLQSASVRLGTVAPDLLKENHVPALDLTKNLNLMIFLKLLTINHNLWKIHLAFYFFCGRSGSCRHFRLNICARRWIGCN